MHVIKQELKRFGVEIAFIDMDAKGFYVNEYSTIFISNSLSDEESRRVIFHEMKHALDHSDYCSLYKITVYRLKMESEANDYMVKKLIDENDGKYNYSQLVEEFSIRMGSEVKYAK